MELEYVISVPARTRCSSPEIHQCIDRPVEVLNATVDQHCWPAVMRAPFASTSRKVDTTYLSSR